MSEIVKTNKDEEAVEMRNHNHPLYTRNVVTRCRGCGKGSTDPCDALYCPRCDVGFHRKCIESLPKIRYPFHSRHPLKLITYGIDGTCRLCSNTFESVFVYRCSICDFEVDLNCVQNPPLLAPDLPDIHEHTLILRPRKVVFTCDACGEDGDRSPYICSQCDFMIHKDCLDLPRVIRINRHHHRLFHTYFLESRGYWGCRVCRAGMDGKYGAYYCSVCHRYAVHPKCATRKDVWDEKELEEIYEENENNGIILPYKVINDTEINHICHEKHNLKIIRHGVVGDENMCCQACALPIDSYPIYKCMQCDDFIIHEKCVNLPTRQQHVLHNHRLTLHADLNQEFRKLFRCSACYRFSSGFNYECCDIKLDVQCASISEPFRTKKYEWWLFHTSRDKKICIGCGEESSFTLSSLVSAFVLDFKCATLPDTMIHEYDDHPLSLLNASGGSGWCEICEKEIDLKTYFYRCEECDSTFHTSCALGDFKYVKTGCVYTYQTSDFKVEAILNDHMTRLLCTACGLRCKGKYLMLIKEHETLIVFK